MMKLLLLLTSLTSVQSLENVARGKPATQSGTWEVYGADLAVDGNYTNKLHKGGCAHPSTKEAGVLPEDKDGPAWWRVDLGQEFDVYQVKIYNRDSFRDRLNDTWVLVSNEERPAVTVKSNICNYITDGEKDIVEVTCNYDESTEYKRGRYVMLSRVESERALDPLNNQPH